MMDGGEKIYFNGSLTEQQPDKPVVASLLRSNYIYAAVNTTGHEPLYLEKHLDYAVNSYHKLYGQRPKPDADELRQQIRTLLRANNMPILGNIVNIYFIPSTADGTSGTPNIVVACDRSTIYRGYELISIRPQVILTNYEIPFSGHRTSISLTAADYMQAFALRSGAHAALRTNRAEKLVSCGEYPIFLTKEGTLYTPPAPATGPLCVERELMYRACSMAGIGVVEREIEAAELAGAEEIMVFNHTGLQSVLCWGSYYFYNLLAMRLEKQLKEITREGLNH